MREGYKKGIAARSKFLRNKRAMSKTMPLVKGKSMGKKLGGKAAKSTIKFSGL